MCHSFSNEYKNLHNGTHKDEAGTNNLDELLSNVKNFKYAGEQSADELENLRNAVGLLRNLHAYSSALRDESEKLVTTITFAIVYFLV